MSSPDECKLMAGHPPAVKAGGMRITQHKNPEREPKPAKESEESKLANSTPAVTISGAPSRGHADFPPEAVQHFHDKPTPTHEARTNNCSKTMVIQQPRK
ncbi:hypothetical protein HCN44_004032 [Aphidius gifuensis]|uniref:Death-associated protein 1 n=1 Tax=Aphidius gifuensis TaxID=684658 RepID=A0A834XW60_APHGI|nr:death-associated protein 1 [Aphidius gifuensis]KAF7994560.1 hypothetical protein HCN44_004032 [Aphidius gifuensis]